MSLILKKKLLSDNELLSLNGFLIPQQNLHLNNVKAGMQAAGLSGEAGRVPGIYVMTQVLRKYPKRTFGREALRFYPSIINSWKIPRQKPMLFLAYN